MLGIQNLSKRYGDVVAVADISLTVPRGSIVGFVGPNGAGKSTTMRSIFGLVRPDSGTITWDGTPVSTAVTNRFGYMPEQRGLYPKMKIAEQIAYFAQLKSVEKKTARERALQLLEDLGLSDRAEDPLEKLSHGNQQRVQLAVSLASEPELLVLDEPFNGLDPVAVNTLQRVLAERVRAGVGILFSSHQLDLVERLCDQVVMIAEGRVRAAGTVHAVRASSGHRNLTIELEAASPGNIPSSAAEVVLHHAIGGRELIRSTTGSVTIAVADPGELEQILALAQQAGPIARFDYDLPPLADMFANLVAPTRSESGGVR